MNKNLSVKIVDRPYEIAHAYLREVIITKIKCKNQIEIET